MRVTSNQAKEKLNSCYTEYAEFKRQAGQQRKNWLLELANERASLEDKTRKDRFQCRKYGQQSATTKHIKMILQLKGIRIMYRQIHYAVGKQRMKRVTMVLEKNSTGEWVKRNTPQEIFQALTKEYHAKYHQTEQTPPMRNPMVHMLGYLGTNNRSDCILDGQLEYVLGLHQYLCRLLQKLRKIPDYKDIPAGISAKQYQQGWKKAKESKSSGGKIIHFGHCKYMAQDDGLWN